MDATMVETVDYHCARHCQIQTSISEKLNSGTQNIGILGLQITYVSMYQGKTDSPIA
jgi:hypothetical protein